LYFITYENVYMNSTHLAYWWFNFL
jgi:hypothetical protein